MLANLSDCEPGARFLGAANGGKWPDSVLPSLGAEEKVGLLENDSSNEKTNSDFHPVLGAIYLTALEYVALDMKSKYDRQRLSSVSVKSGADVRHSKTAALWRVLLGICDSVLGRREVDCTCSGS